MSGHAIIGLSGPAHSGKSTVAKHLIHDHKWQKVSFASPIKTMIGALGVSPSALYGNEKNESCPELLGRSARYGMQTLGDWGRSIHPDLWVEHLRMNAMPLLHAGKCLVCDDVRYANEATAIRELGGVIVQIKPSYEGYNASACANGSHSSEAGLHEDDVDFVLENAGSIDDILTAIAALHLKTPID